MKRAILKSRYRFIFIPFAAAAFLALISFTVMQLWNNLLPDILHVSLISFWQAMGLFILCKILFGFGRGGRFGGGAPWMRKSMEDRFNNMTPEERIRFKEQFGDRMCRGRWGRGDWKEQEEKPAADAAE